jgi:hypothetical protein
MNQAIEDYLAGLFATAQLVPAPNVFTGTSSDIRTPDSDAILVLADSIENVVGPLHRATVKILVSSPTDDRAQHAALAHAVKDIIEAALPAAIDFKVGGFRTKSHATAVTDDDRWLTTIEGILGVDWTPVDNQP